MPTIPDTPDIRAALDATIAPIREAVKRLKQLHDLGASSDAAVESMRAERDEARTECDEARAARTEAEGQRDEARAKVRELESKLAEYADHPDVKAARKKRLEELRDAAAAELAKLNP